jgi:biotin-dependent carboxylase-like uncharacterized protein
MIEILSTRGLAAVQDLGRDRHYRFGVSIGGAMDRVALALGNALVGNPDDAAAIEIPVFPFRVAFRSATEFALTGADCNADLDGVPVLPNWAMPVREGQVLTLNAPLAGAFAYLSILGGIDVPKVLGSRSTNLRAAFGGHDGRVLREGDVLSGGSAAESVSARYPIANGGFGAEAPESALAFAGADGMEGERTTMLRVLPAAEYDRFDEESRKAFWESRWRITPQSNRSGYRLAGPSLTLTTSLEMRSHGIVPGVIQVPMGGTPIIQTADSQTAGGYPKIATVIEADLWRLGQAPIGTYLRFIETAYPEALAALELIRTYLGKVRFLVETCRRMPR